MERSEIRAALTGVSPAPGLRFAPSGLGLLVVARLSAASVAFEVRADPNQFELAAFWVRTRITFIFGLPYCHPNDVLCRQAGNGETFAASGSQKISYTSGQLSPDVVSTAINSSHFSNARF